jgi:hypothetical protein
MVQAIENWYCVIGTIGKLDRRSGDGNAGQAVLLLQVDKVKPVAGYPALIRTEDTTEISVVVRSSQLDGDAVNGQRVRIPVRVAGPDRYFAHPDWSFARGSTMCGAN